MRLPYVILLALLTFIAGGVLATIGVLAVMTLRPVEMPAPTQEVSAPVEASAQAAEETVAVLVARGRMAKWSSLRSMDTFFETRQLPASEVPPNFVPPANAAAVKGRILRGTLAEGYILTEADLLPPTVKPVVVLYTRDKMTQWSTVRVPEEQFQARPVPSSEAPANFVPAESLASLKGRRLRSTVAEGTLLTEDHLLKKEVSGIDGMLDKGKIAVSVPISPTGRWRSSWCRAARWT